MDSNSLQIQHDESRNKFFVTIEGQESYILYRLQEGEIDILSTQVSPSHRGGGVAAKLTKFALEFARENNLRVVPSCSYTAAYLQRHR